MMLGVILLSVAAIGVVAYGFIADYIEDQRRPGSTAVRIDDVEYDLRYYTSRLTTYVQQNSGSQAASDYTIALPAVRDLLVDEAVMLKFAGELAITATEDEINAEIALRLQTQPDAADFQTRLQDELDRTDISEDQFREQIEAAVLRRKLQEHFIAALPETEESVHYRQILVATREEADGIKGEIEGGADAAAIAKEKSLDTTTSEEGGDAGWVPKGVLTAAVEDTIFSMEVDEVRVQEVGASFFVFQMLEKDDARAIEDDQKPTLGDRMLSEWLTEKRGMVTVEDQITTDGEKAAWAVERAYNL
jgi:parvulin-like peptidyl-prolyl isomerase